LVLPLQQIMRTLGVGYKAVNLVAIKRSAAFPLLNVYVATGKPQNRSR